MCTHIHKHTHYEGFVYHFETHFAYLKELGGRFDRRGQKKTLSRGVNGLFVDRGLTYKGRLRAAFASLIISELVFGNLAVYALLDIFHTHEKLLIGLIKLVYY